MNIAAIIEDELSATEARKELARRHMADFVRHTNTKYTFNWHHVELCNKIDDFIAGRIRKLMVFMPPQHGKSELTTRRLPAMLLGLNPDLRIAIESYSSTVASGFNKDVQRIVDDNTYYDLFPFTRFSDGRDEFTRNTDKVEVVNNIGYLKTVGIMGALTSLTVDVNILDDPFKDREEAASSTIQEKVYNQYYDVIRTRMHNDSKELLIMTRWDENDLAGMILTQEHDWTIVMFQGIRERIIMGVVDPRPIGAALWPDKHSLERLKKIKRDNPLTFDSLYQQEPKKPTEQLVFTNYVIIDELPEFVVPTYGIDFGYTNDPASCVGCERHNKGIYLDEVLYKTGLSNKALLQHIEAAGVNKRRQFFADPSEPKDIAELAAMGMNIQAADNSHARITEMKNDYTIFVTRRSHNLIRELNKYGFITIGKRVTNEVAPGQEDHAVDAGRYAYAGAKQGKAKIGKRVHS